MGKTYRKNERYSRKNNRTPQKSNKKNEDHSKKWKYVGATDEEDRKDAYEDMRL